MLPQIHKISTFYSEHTAPFLRTLRFLQGSLCLSQARCTFWSEGATASNLVCKSSKHQTKVASSISKNHLPYASPPQTIQGMITHYLPQLHEAPPTILSTLMSSFQPLQMVYRHFRSIWRPMRMTLCPHTHLGAPQVFACRTRGHPLVHYDGSKFLHHGDFIWPPQRPNDSLY